MPDLTDPDVREALSDRDDYLGDAARNIEKSNEDETDSSSTNDDSSGGTVAERTGVVKDPETGEVVKADSEQAQNIDTSSDFNNTDTSDSGSSSSSSDNTSEAVNADQINNKPLDIPEAKDPSNLESRKAENPEKTPDYTAVRTSVTVEDQQTKAPTESGKRVSRAQLKEQRAQAQQAKENLEASADFLEQQGKTQEAEKLRNKAKKAEKEKKKIEENIRKIGQPQQQNNDTRTELENRIRNEVGRPAEFPEAGAKTNRDNPLEGAAPNPEQIVRGGKEIIEGNTDTGVETLDRGLGDFFSPNRQVSSNLDLSEEAVLTGQDIIRQTDEQAENIIEETNPPEFLGSGPAGLIAGVEQTAQGDVLKGAETALVPGSQSELEKKRIRQLQEGAVSGPGQLSGFAVGGTGAVATSIEEGTTIQDLQKGSAKIAAQAGENPGRFATEELGEEIGEGIATAGIGALTPTITPEISTPDTLQDTARFVKGNLGTRARETQLRLNLEDTEFIRQNIIQGENGERLQTIEGRRITEGGNELTTGEGFRVETPVSRREFLKEKVGLKDREITDFVETDTFGSGLGAFVPETQTPETNTPTTETPDSNIDTDNLFQPTRQPRDPLPETIQPSTLETRPGVNPKIDQREEVELGQTPRESTDFTLDNTVETRLDQIPLLEQGTRQETDLRLETTPEMRLEQERRVEPELRLERERRVEPTLIPEPGKDSFNELFGGESQGDRGFDFAPSIDAVITGSTKTVSEQEFKELQDEEFTGLETRSLIKLENGEKKGQQNDNNRSTNIEDLI